MERAMRSAHWCVIVLSSVVAAGALAGPLNPPAGPIAPTAKPLAEVEPRAAVNATNTPGDDDSFFRITQSGSYYLTGNVVCDSPKMMGIEIAAQNVTLDLNGFTVLCTAPGPFSGIRSTAFAISITIMNGSVQGFGGDGIALTGGVADGLRVVGVHTRDNVGHGIFIEKTALVEGCTAVTNGLNGIWVTEMGTIRSCQSLGNGQNGIVAGVVTGVGSNSVVEGCSSVGNGDNGFSLLAGASVTNCVASANGFNGFAQLGHGVFIGCASKDNLGSGFQAYAQSVLDSGCVFSQCESSRNQQHGIQVTSLDGVSPATVERCTVVFNVLDGINAASEARVMFNTCNINGGANVHITGSSCVVESNTVSFGNRGILVDAPNNLVVRNLATGNATNFVIVANNKVGVIVTAPNSGAINGSTGGAGVGSTDPTANVVY